MSQLLDLLAFSMTLRFRLATRPDSQALWKPLNPRRGLSAKRLEWMPTPSETKDKLGDFLSSFGRKKASSSFIDRTANELGLNKASPGNKSSKWWKTFPSGWIESYSNYIWLDPVQARKVRRQARQEPQSICLSYIGNEKAEKKQGNRNKSRK